MLIYKEDLGSLEGNTHQKKLLGVHSASRRGSEAQLEMETKILIWITCDLIMSLNIMSRVMVSDAFNIRKLYDQMSVLEIAGVHYSHLFVSSWAY